MTKIQSQAKKHKYLRNFKKMYGIAVITFIPALKISILLTAFKEELN